ncbi:ribosome maturation factor RimP [bacterium]|nr:ribosome maturation factor RimP [candidate division CSSED10-310 bacterium]
MKQVEQTVFALAETVAEPMGLEILEAQFVYHSKRIEVRIVLDRQSEPVSVSDCASFSRQLSRILDVEDPIESAYVLEVSSPGFRRLIRVPRDLTRFIGHRVRLKLREPIADRRVWIGSLMNDIDPLRIDTGEIGELAISFERIERINLHD